ncbi:MAG: DUF971 domain-containing protein [Acidobacteriota bacterium]|nr:DUF971 domain-containing protein [Acidobacteriota bacterium]
MPINIDPRKKPLAIKIHVSSGAGVDITWADHHTSHYDFPYLREECPCAMCNEKREQEHHSGNTAKSPALMSSPALPMFKPKVRAQSASQVGNYAVQINFNDGHNTGIFSYDHLRTICPCVQCAATFRNVST